MTVADDYFKFEREFNYSITSEKPFRCIDECLWKLFSIISKLKSHYFLLTVRHFVLFAFATFLKINLISTFCAARDRLTYSQLISLLKFCHVYYKIGNNRVNSKKQLVMVLSPNATENKSKKSFEHLFNQPILQRVMTFVGLVAVKSQ